MKVHKSDAVVVGAGLAGLRAAIEIASKGFTVHIISLVPPRQSHSNAAQGGIQASLANTKDNQGDDWKTHFNDTIKGSDWGADQDIVENVCKLAPRLIRELEYWGTPFSRTAEGKINQRNFGGTSKPRCAFASDGTGHSIIYALDGQRIALKIPVFIERQMLSLIRDGELNCGITALNLKNGEIEIFLAPVVILATGGAGMLYGKNDSTNGLKCYGDGQIIALETGIIPIGNPEAIQFHPTALVPSSILVTEGCRGDGGVLLDKNGKEFMWNYSPEKGNLASRDVVSRSMMRHIQKGFGIDSPYGPHLYLDIKRLGEKHIKTKLADVDFLCRTFIGIDPTKEYIPVRPSHHYTMFGIKTGAGCEVYNSKGLFAIGECACWDMHGFNRLGGNSLLETIAAGYISGKNAVEYLSNYKNNKTSHFFAEDEYRKQQKRIHKLICSNGKENPYEIFKEMQNVLKAKAGIFRNGKDLEKGIEELKLLRQKAQKIGLRCRTIGPNLELQLALRLDGMLKLALCIIQSALSRAESRGSHYRDDYPQRDDANWLKRTLSYFPLDAEFPKIEYEPVKITLLPPGDRGYGEKASEQHNPRPTKAKLGVSENAHPNKNSGCSDKFAS